MNEAMEMGPEQSGESIPTAKKQALIDIGSNSIRLSLYEIDGDKFKILFREKIMAGLAGYVEARRLSAEGIECACSGLLEFRKTLQILEIENVRVFATASLRNISNTEQALSVIYAATGFEVEVVSGEEEALFGYTGAMQELHLMSGAFMDVGGASTEIVTFDEGEAVTFESFPVGSLSLYKKCVKNILPGAGSLKRLNETISESLHENADAPAPRPLIVGVGGTARAALKMARYYFGFSEDCQSISREQIDDLCQFLCEQSKDAIDMILRLEAERIHTLIPGLLVLQHTLKIFQAEQLIVSNYGVREGYLCQRIMNNTYTLKTEN